MRPLVVVGASGCLLPLAILVNTFFGLFFLRPLHWLLTEAVLFLIFFLSAALGARRIMNAGNRPRKGVIDVEGKVVDADRSGKGEIGHEK